MLPDRLVVRAYLYRGTKIWVITRAALIVVLLRGGADPLRISASTLISVIALSVAMAFLDTRLHRESALLGNLGVSPLVIGILFFGPALLGETVLRLVGAALA